MRGGSAPGLEDARSIAGLLRFQGVACLEVGSPLYADLLARAADDYELGGPTRAVLEGHEDDPKDSALALRLMGAVHRLALEGEAPELAERYAATDGDRDATWAAFRATLAGKASRLAALVDRPVQTNEVGRCAALLTGFLGVYASTDLPLRLLEIGASGGLNLRWDSYRFEADGFSWGSPDSPLRIRFDLSGGAIPAVPATVVERAGCDAAPVDAGSEEGRLTLLSYAWPDQPARMERLRFALELAAREPIEVQRADAVEWVRGRLAEPATGAATVVFHSIVMQYLTATERDELRAVIFDAGRRARPDAPLAWLRMEPAERRAAIRLTLWPGGEDRLLAHSGYHGTPVELDPAP